ncbi:MAG: phasin family protein [Burkholderiaceae bacterium]|nr:phasin family protein [Burkholderiaceae bacterium]
MAEAIPQFGEMMFKSAAQTCSDVAAATFKGMEKMAHVQLNVARETLNHSAESMKALTSAKSPQDIMKVQAAMAKLSMESLTALTGAACGIGVETAKALSQMQEAQVAEFGERIHNAIEQFAKYAPAGSESSVALARSAWNAAGQAFETATNATRQAIAAAERNVESVGKVSLNLVKSA